MTAGTMILAWLPFVGSLRSPARDEILCGAELKTRIVQPRNDFEASLQDGTWSLRYKFRSSSGSANEVSCRVDDQRHRQLRDEFGLLLCDAWKLDKRRPHKPAACKERSERTIRPLTQSQEIFDAYLVQRGFRKIHEEFIPNYPRLTTKAAETLQECAQRLHQELGSGENSRNAWLSFFQAMRPDDDGTSWTVPEIEASPNGPKWNAGLLVPTDVLTLNRGDCDSKALCFLSLQTNKTENWVLFRSLSQGCSPDSTDGHAFVAVERGSISRPRRFNLNEVLLQGVKIDGSAFDQDVLKARLEIGILMEYEVMDLTGPGMTKLGELDPQKYGWYIGFPVEAGRLNAAPR